MMEILAFIGILAIIIAISCTIVWAVEWSETRHEREWRLDNMELRLKRLEDQAPKRRAIKK
jgi:hypothetical protein